MLNFTWSVGYTQIDYKFLSIGKRMWKTSGSNISSSDRDRKLTRTHSVIPVIKLKGLMEITNLIFFLNVYFFKIQKIKVDIPSGNLQEEFLLKFSWKNRLDLC